MDINFYTTGHGLRSNDVEMDTQKPGCKPQPSECGYEQAMARAFQCIHYKECLGHASSMRWRGWDCMRCPTDIPKQPVDVL